MTAAVALLALLEPWFDGRLPRVGLFAEPARLEELLREMAHD